MFRNCVDLHYMNQEFHQFFNMFSSLYLRIVGYIVISYMIKHWFLRLFFVVNTEQMSKRNEVATIT